MRALTLALLAALVAAGCVAPAADDLTGQSLDFVDPIVEEHDHSDPTQHMLWTPNIRQLAHHALGDEPNATRGTYGEIDIVGDMAYVAVLGDGGEVPGFVALDIRDRAAPRLVSFTPSPGTRVADVKADPEGQYLFLGGEKGLRPSPNGALGAATGGVGGVMGYGTRNGVRVYDVSDPAAPRLVDYAPSDSGCHMLFFKAIGTGEWVFCVGVGINVYELDRATGRLALASRYAPMSPQEQAGLVAANPTDPYSALLFDGTPHDITLQDDAATGKTLMYASYWDLGLRIVDVSDPKRPVEVGRWVGEEAERWAGNIHTAMAHETPDGRRLVYVIPELFTGVDVPAVFVVDATDLAAPKLVGEWAAPGEHGNDGIRFSTHNFQVVDGRLYLAYYHAGVWVLDISGENATSPAFLGYYLPHAHVKTQLPAEKVNVPDIWDVVLKDGHLYATDIHSGLYVLHYEEDTLGDATLTSFA